MVALRYVFQLEITEFVCFSSDAWIVLQVDYCSRKAFALLIFYNSDKDS